MIAKDEIQILAKRWKIDQFTILREYMQLLLLYYLYGLKESEDLFFKGGTAIRLLFGSFRFSEDLDFTSLLSPERTKMLFEDAIARMKKEAPEITLESFIIKRYSFISRLKIQPFDIKHPIGIHIEISVREKVLTRSISPIETLYPISPYPLVSHLSAEEILAEKIRALIKREKGRDLFDIWYLMSKEVSLRWDMVDEKMRFYKEDLNSNRLISRIEGLDDRKIKDDLNKFLPIEHRQIICQLKTRVIERLRKSGHLERTGK